MFQLTLSSAGNISRAYMAKNEKVVLKVIGVIRCTTDFSEKTIYKSFISTK